MWWSRHLENADTVIRCRFVSWWHPAVKVIPCGFRQNSDWSGVTSWELKMLLCPVEGHIKHTLSEYVSSIWHQALSFSTIFGPNFVLFDIVCLLTCLIILWINTYHTHYVSFCTTLCVILSQCLFWVVRTHFRSIFLHILIKIPQGRLLIAVCAQRTPVQLLTMQNEPRYLITCKLQKS